MTPEIKKNEPATRINGGGVMDAATTCASGIASKSSAINGGKEAAEEVVQVEAVAKDVMGDTYA